MTFRRFFASILAAVTFASVSHAASDTGVLSMLIIPPEASLDWSSPNSLIRSSAISKLQGEINKRLGHVNKPHPIGHLMIRMVCPGVSIPLTGMTGGGSEFASAFDGLGATFRTFPGYLDDSSEVAPDISRRRSSGRIATLNFRITTEMCHHLAGFLAEYKAHGADQRYGGQYRPRRFEGGGCSSFALAFIEVGGLLKRSQFTPVFARELHIGIGRIADYQGSGVYAYGSNLTARDETGATNYWPKGASLRVQLGAISPQSPWLASWADSDDARTNPVPSEQPDLVPWTIYDPELVWNFAKSLHQAGGGDALGRNWTVSSDLNSVVLETDATDATPEPYLDPQDDLRLD